MMMNRDLPFTGTNIHYIILPSVVGMYYKLAAAAAAIALSCSLALSKSQYLFPIIKSNFQHRSDRRMLDGRTVGRSVGGGKWKERDSDRAARRLLTLRWLIMYLSWVSEHEHEWSAMSANEAMSEEGHWLTALIHSVPDIWSNQL